jgi:5-methylcytosine-specific restriction endonuclease McrA
VTTTLVLNASFEPLDVVPARRAVVLVLADRAELVEAGAGSFRAASISMPSPSVIRLLRYVVTPHRTLQLSRRNVLARDEYRCAYCRRHARTVDHVVPRSRGGTNVWTNVVAACAECNQKKANRTPAEAGLTLHVTPHRPTGHEAWAIRHGEAVTAWAPYVGAAR